MLFPTVTVNIYDVGIKSISKNMFTENTACRGPFEISRFTTSADRPRPRYHKVHLYADGYWRGGEKSTFMGTITIIPNDVF